MASYVLIPASGQGSWLIQQQWVHCLLETVSIGF